MKKRVQNLKNMLKIHENENKSLKKHVQDLGSKNESLEKENDSLKENIKLKEQEMIIFKIIVG